jgi:SOS-response transcriptional repressor LexA
MSDRLSEQKMEIERILAATKLPVEELAERVHLKEDTVRKYAGGYQPASSRVMAALRQIEREIAGPAETESHYVADGAPGDPRAALRAAREKRGLSLKDLARLTKVSAAHLGDLEGGSAPMSAKVFNRLLKELPDLDRDQFFGRADLPPVIDKSGRASTMGASNPMLLPRGETARQLPRLSYVEAGTLIEWTDDLFNHEGVWVKDFPPHKRGFVLPVRGDSMEPRFFAGDEVAVEWGKEPLNGDVVVALTTRGEPLLKRYSAHDRGKRIVLTSENFANHPPLEFRAEELRWVWPVHSLVYRRVNQ